MFRSRLRQALVVSLAVAAAQAGADPGAAVDFTMMELSSQRRVQLRDLPQRPMLIHVWRSDCAACLKELPSLDAESKRWPGVEFIGIGAEPVESAAAFLKRHPLALKMYLASDAAELMQRLGAPFVALPFSAMLDAEHRLCWSHMGITTLDEVRQGLRQCSVASR